MLYVQLYLLAGAAAAGYLVAEIWMLGLRARPEQLSLAEQWVKGGPNRTIAGIGAVLAGLLIVVTWPYFVVIRTGGPPRGV